MFDKYYSVLFTNVRTCIYTRKKNTYLFISLFLTWILMLLSFYIIVFQYHTHINLFGLDID